MTDLQSDDWTHPQDSLGGPSLEGVRTPRPRLSYGIPSLDDFVPLVAGLRNLVVVALPYQPASEITFVVAQAFARQGHAPLCVNPGWSPYWDGALAVHRLEGAPNQPVVDYATVTAFAGQGQPVIVDQFHRLHWDIAKSHADREDVIAEAGRKLNSLAAKTHAPVVVFTHRRTKNVVKMSGDDLRSDGALEYVATAFLMVDPHPKTETADFLMLKNRNGPTGAFPGVHWPVLPRTAAYRAT